MKKLIITFAALLAFIGYAKSEETSIIKNVLKEYVINKVNDIQEIIKFSDEQAKQLIKIEYEYYVAVEQVENCTFCNKAKKIKKLKLKKDEEVQKVLNRADYIKYDAIENNRIKKYPLWAK